MDGITISSDDPRTPDVKALLERHLAFAHEHSPPDDVHALDSDGLAAENISFFAARDSDVLLGIGALRQLDDTHVELKSMHTTATARGRGVGRGMLEHLLDVAESRGCTRVSLETGSMDAFLPARTLYASVGFVECPPFGSYDFSRNSTCMTLELSSRRRG